MRFLLLLLAATAMLSLAGCPSRDDDVFSNNPSKIDDPEAKKIAIDIAALANGGKANDPAASVAYDRAVDALIKRGVKVETRIIDALRSDADANVRLGCIEVLAAVGTKACIEQLIAVLDDPAPLVAWKAEITLRVLTKQRFIPEDGQPAKDGLPPVPKRKPEDLKLDAEEQLWATWHAQHKAELKAVWERWWAKEKATFKLD